MFLLGGRALNELGALPGYQTQSNSEYLKVKSGRQFASEKVRKREGKIPDRPLRSPRLCSVEKDVETLKQLGCWLRSSHHLKKA
jgi:hypothetical protein